MAGRRLGIYLLTAVAAIGNNYTITNESRTKTAKIFFAQGCELEASAAHADGEGDGTATEQ